jgi:hypothetical protein
VAAFAAALQLLLLFVRGFFFFERKGASENGCRTCPMFSPLLPEFCSWDANLKLEEILDQQAINTASFT